MTIVTKSSLTLSNVNDGTITHYAYANSADGKEGFYVGGATNLLQGTQDFSGSNWLNLGSSWIKTDETYNGLSVVETTSDWNGIAQYYQVKQGETYTFSLFARYTSGTGTSNFYIMLNFDPENGHKNAQVDNTTLACSLDTNWKKCSITFTATADGYVKPRMERTDNNTNVLRVCGFMFEEGTVAHPWSPAPSEAHPSYIGQYTDFSTTASTDPAKYAPWIIFKGNDGTITHIAYANSADGTDRFTTVYPNLNLLVGTRDFSGTWPQLSDWVNDGIYKGVVVKKRTGKWYGINKTFTVPRDGTYTFSAYIKSSGNTANISRYGAGGQIYKFIGNNFDWTRDSITLNLKANDSVHVRYEIAGDGTDSILWTAGHKWEEGSVATPYMPSSSEATTADWPSYIGQYTDFTQDDSTNSSAYTWSLIRGNDGKDGANGKDGIAGKDGVGIKTTDITYAISTSGTTAPTTGWTSSVPSLVKGQYLWTKTDWTYTDNSSETGYSVTYISKDGNNGNDGIAGKDGIGIKSTTITYTISSSGTVTPTTGWTSSVPPVPAGQYLWTKTVWNYSDGTSEAGYSVAKMGDTGATGPAGPPGSNGDPGKIVSNTEPTTKFNGLTWKYSGENDITASDGTTILAGTEYYWNGTVWTLYEINAHNINGDNLSVSNGTFKDGKIESIWGSNGVNGTTTIESNHLIIHSTDSVANTESTVALDNEQGYAQVYVDKKTGRTITVQVSSQGFFVSDSTGPFVRVTPNGISTSSDKSQNSFQIGAGISLELERRGDVVEATLWGTINSSLVPGKAFTVGKIPVGYRPNKAINIPAHMTSSVNSSHIDAGIDGVCTWWGPETSSGYPRGTQTWFTDDASPS